MSAAVVFENVSKYGAVENLNLTVETGERVLLRSGDPVILRLVAGMEEPDGGTISALGADVSSLPKGEAAAFRNARIGYAGQDSALFPALTVLENAALYLTIRGITRNQRASAAKGFLTMLGLSHVMHNYPRSLSIAEKRRTALARALVAEPVILLLDNLFAGLRENEAAELADYINSAYDRDGFTVLICAAEVPPELKLDREEMV